MRFNPEPFTQHRLSRFHRWAMLLLKWISAFLDEAMLFAPLSKQAQDIAHQWLDRIERGIVAIIMLRAAPHVRRHPPLKHAEHPRSGAAFIRAVMGSAMRRPLRSKDLHRRIEALRQDIGVLVVRLLRRLPRGLTRRRPIKTQHEMRADAWPDVCAPPSLLSDTS